MKLDKFFEQVEEFGNASLIFLRSVELKLLKQHWQRKLKARRILDLGCGNGLTAKLVFGRGVAFGADKNKKVLEKAKQRGIYKQAILGLANDLGLAKQSCDLVFSNCVLEHIKELDPVLAEVNRVLITDGRLVFTSVTNNFYKYSLLGKISLGRENNLVKRYGRFRDKRMEHYHSYDLKIWSELLMKHGFKIEDSYYYFDKKNIESWDLILLWSSFWNKISVDLNDWWYKKWLRKMIYNQFLQAKAGDESCGAIAIMAKKIKQ